jgi:hypothetical protein
MSKKIDYNNDIKKKQVKVYSSKSMGSESAYKSSKETKTNSKSTKGKSGSKTLKKTSKKEAIVPKKRGRKPKKILESFDEAETTKETHLEIESESEKEEPMPTSTNRKPTNEISSVVCRLPIDPSKLEKYRHLQKTVESKKSSKKKEQIIVMGDEESEGIFRNDIPCDTTCSKCVKNEKIIASLKNRLEKYNTTTNSDKIINQTYKVDLNLVSLSTNKKIKNGPQTNIKCYWDTCMFETTPFYLVELFHDSTYYVVGCFCDISCALAYNLYYLRDSKVHQRKALTIKLYKEMCKLSPEDKIDIKEAGPRELLKDYGGKYTIEQYRKLCCGNKDYVSYNHPIKSLVPIIEERNTETVVQGTTKKYTLKRSKPLVKKKSIMSSMNISYDEEED